MKTFDELFKDASLIGDKRNKVLFQLVSKAENEVFPAFSNALKGFGLKKAFFSLAVKPFRGNFAPKLSYGEELLYHFAVNEDGRIDICDKDDYTNRYSVQETYRFKECDNKELENLPVISLTRVGVMSVLEAINNRMEELNKKFTEQTEKAEVLLNKQA